MDGWRGSAGQCHLVSIKNGQPGGLGRKEGRVKAVAILHGHSMAP